MFPYPSGSGLHLGHFYNYAIMDSYCRFLRYDGQEVFQPFGYDAFGLPAENYARQIGGDVKEITFSNIAKFRKQMQDMNTQYDEKLITADPSYYKWTQWLFTKLHEKGLAYKAKGEVNYCLGCETVLANEQVANDRCERCSSPVEQKVLDQWYFKITAYKDRLIENLDSIDYPKSTIKRQRHWLNELRDWCVSRQRKWGCPIPIEGETDTLDTFVDSSFYFLRYLTNSDEEFLPKGSYQPVDLYVGGPEHACMHLIYARFIHMFLYDLGIVPQEEPFNKVIHQGMITKDGAKMGKSKGNAVNPDDFNSDELRLGLMFIGPYFEGGDWVEHAGVRRFLKRLRKWFSTATIDGETIDLSELKDTIKRQTETFKFNLVVSSFMKFYNKNKNKVVSTACRDEFIALFQNFAPDFKV
jgi:leucyl-tRNA synthetase